MANNAIINNDGKKIALYRTYTKNTDLSSNTYLAPSVFKVGINGITPNIDNKDLSTIIPISNGTVNDDGTNTLTGSGDGINSTDNTTTYKIGAGLTDDTAQNLISTGTGHSIKNWKIDNLSTSGNNISGTGPFAFWFYIKDASTLAKFNSGTGLKAKFGTDSSNYYYKDILTSNLSTGWNWITSGSGDVEDLPVIGTGSGTSQYFEIEILTTATGDNFAEGDIVYDLLRQWGSGDLVKDLSTGYPTFDYNNLEMTTRGYLNVLEGNGFLIDNTSLHNEDSTPLMSDEAKIDSQSKTETEEIIFLHKNRII